MRARLFLPALFAASAVATAVGAQTLAGGQRVEFKVESMRGGDETLVGYAFAPQAAPAGAKLPAVVIVHGSGGVRDAREGFWGRSLAAFGMVALAIDSFTPRGVKSTVDDQSRVPTAQMVRDAFGALDYLVKQPFVDPERVALMGMSKGGSVALLAADRRTRAGERMFAAHVPLYPGCTVQYRSPQVAAPILMLIGEADDYTGVKTCADYAARIRAAGGSVQLKTYPGVHHAFDGDTSSEEEIRLPKAQNYRDCVVYNEDDGRTVYGRTGELLDTPQKALEVLRRDCIRLGATVAANARAKQQALEDVKGFLKATLIR
jgi:dienelactone hydrolase